MARYGLSSGIGVLDSAKGAVMTDRELLELAAKAAGIDWCAYYRTKVDNCSLCLQPDGRVWNPLTDDGDALRLAVQTGEPFVVRTSCVTTMGGLLEVFDPAIPGDDLRATRRAIVCAAAEIGKKMP